mmetsp:Transcript_10162/g.20334  ORF Transcript_10162/g.20334 Transcript_10162/m.20334 type:complete len:223 (-) Transcript_10162:978-1646(-)
MACWCGTICCGSFKVVRLERPMPPLLSNGPARLDLREGSRASTAAPNVAVHNTSVLPLLKSPDPCTLGSTSMCASKDLNSSNFLPSHRIAPSLPLSPRRWASRSAFRMPSQSTWWAACCKRGAGHPGKAAAKPLVRRACRVASRYARFPLARPLSWKICFASPASRLHATLSASSTIDRPCCWAWDGSCSFSSDSGPGPPPPPPKKVFKGFHRELRWCPERS